MKAGLHSYYKKIEVVGLEHVPKDKPVLFLPNHQNALLDVLLIVTDCKRKPYFLTRSDVFGKPLLNRVFSFLRMIPIYRIRDGRHTLAKNDVIFDQCATLLGRGEAMVMFPEGNHSLKRQVRPLSKGFTRVLFRTLEKYPELDIQLVPIGLNYKDAKHFPDAVSIQYGEAIPVQSILTKTEDISSMVNTIKQVVSESLQSLTTHISPDFDYNSTLQALDAARVNYLAPKTVNAIIGKMDTTTIEPNTKDKFQKKTSIFYMLFMMMNFPVVGLWKYVIKPKVWETEFMSTLRFATAILGYFLHYLALFLVACLILNVQTALLAILLLFGFNWLYVKYG